jgi:PLD-like domain
MEKLLKRPATEIKSQDGLHAKVYLTPDAVIIGSANASANGLGEEADEIDLALEVAALITDETVRADASQWFECMWSDACPVNIQAVKSSRPFWESNRSKRPNRGSVGPTILSMLDRNPSWFRDRQIRLLACEGADFSPQAKQVYRRVAPLKYSERQIAEYENNYYPCYEDATGWVVKPGDYILGPVRK